MRINFVKVPKLLFLGKQYFLIDNILTIGRPIAEIKVSGWLGGYRPPSRGHRLLRGGRRPPCTPPLNECIAHRTLLSMKHAPNLHVSMRRINSESFGQIHWGIFAYWLSIRVMPKYQKH